MSNSVIYYNGTNLGLGTTSPTAYLTIKAGTATAGTAPLKLTAGTNLTTTEAGAIEYDGSHLYFTSTNAGTRYQLDQQAGTYLSAGTTNNSILRWDFSGSAWTEETSFLIDTAGNTTGGTYNGLTLTSATDGFTIAGGSTTSRTLTVTGADVSLNQSLQTTDTPTFATLNTGQGNYELYAMNQDLKTTDTPTFAGMNLAGNLLPTADNTYDLGSASYRWKDLYLGPGSLNMYNSYTDGSNYELAKLSYVSNVLTLASSSAGTGTARDIQIKAGTNDGIYLDTTGNVGIGTTNPGLALDVVGNARFSAIGSGASSGALYYTADGTLTTSSSDIRLKQNIVTIENPLDKVMALRGVTYNWKDPNSPKRMMGMIAQEVIGVAPELVFQNETDGYYGINYGETSGLLIEAIKEQQGEITSITENQNQIVKQLTGQLADQNLSVDNKLQLIGTSLSVLTSEQDEIIKDQIKNFKDSLSQSMQDTSEIKKNLKILEEQMADLKEQNQAVIDFATALNLDSLIYKNALGNLDLGDGKLEADGVVAGAFTVKVVDEEKRTIGSNYIESENKNDDGFSYLIKTKAVTESCVILTNFQANPNAYNWVEKVKDATTGEYIGFRVKLSQKTTQRIYFDWWIVEKDSPAGQSVTPPFPAEEIVP